MRVNNVLKNILLVIVASFLALAVSEAFLRLSKPVEIRIRGDKLELPKGRKYVIRNDKTSKLDSIIVITKNQLGFRGSELPADLAGYLSIITIGGSTTECFYLSDGKTWSDDLARYLKVDYGVDNIWINNAGLDGNTTFGHYVLMKDYIARIKPDMVLFLIGINDVGIKQELKYDKQYRKGYYKKSPAVRLANWICSYSEVAALSKNFLLYLVARQRNIYHQPVDFKQLKALDISPDEMDKDLAEHEKKYLPDYENRLLMLIDISRDNGIEPVFITQPALYGPGVDPVTGVDLGKIATGNGRNGELSWKLLELYNDVTRRVGAENNVPVVDLAAEMPKSSEYYYDFHHFSNSGADEVGRIIAAHLYSRLQ